MSSSPLSIDVYVAPMRPYACPDQLGEGEVATWAPSSSTLISGPTEGILIDALLTFENADQIAGWAKRFGKKIAGVYITHGHSDHWLGLARLLQHFPEARGYAAPEVVGRAAWEAEFNKTSKYWTSRFPGELPETPVVPEVLNSDEILVDGQVVNLIHVGQGDVDGSTAFHVPSADAVVCGDVVYNNVHMMMYEADAAKREAWIASVDAIAALNPKIVVAGPVLASARVYGFDCAPVHRDTAPDLRRRGMQRDPSLEPVPRAADALLDVRGGILRRQRPRREASGR